MVRRQRRVFRRVDGGESIGVVGFRGRCEVAILGFWQLCLEEMSLVGLMKWEFGGVRKMVGIMVGIMVG